MVRRWMGVFLTAWGLWSRAPVPLQEWREPLVPAVRVQGEREGLPNLTIQQLIPDAQGRIWAATQEGVSVYNGHRWTPIPLPRQCKSTYARTLQPTLDGALWVGTQDDGLWEYHLGVWRHPEVSAGLTATRINCLLEVPGLPAGSVLLAGTASHGLFRREADHWVSAEGSEHLTIWRLRPDPLDPKRIWAATTDGLAVLNLTEGFRLQFVCPASRGLEVNDVCRARRPDGRVETWLSIWGRGVFAWEGDGLRPASGSARIPSENPSCLAFGPGPDGMPVLWAGTYNAGCYWLDGAENWHRMEFPRMSLAQGVYYILPRPGTRPAIWVGCQAAGVLSVDLEGWRNVNLPFQEASLPTLCFAVTGSREETRYWVGTTQGLGEWNGRSWRRHTTLDGLPDDRVEAIQPITLQGKPHLLASTIKGLATWDGQRWSPFNPPGQGVWRTALKLLPTQVGGKPGLWLGGTQGVTRWSDAGWAPLQNPLGGAPPQVYALAETQDLDGETSLWIGTRGSGLSRYRKGQWLRYGTVQGLEHPSVYALLATRLPALGNRVWAGTPGGGLGWLDPDRADGRWHWITQETHPHLASNSIVSLEQAGASGLWVITRNQGVQLLTIPPGAEDQPERWQFRSFRAADGLPSDYCSDRASLVDAKGRMWVGTLRGAAVFDPHSLGQPEAPVPVLLDAITASGRPLPIQPGFTLPASQRQVTLDFFLPTFYGVEDQAFRTQLQPVEHEPTGWTNDRRRELSGLAPGGYTLRVWGRDALGRVTEPLDIPFRISYPLWRHPWAYVFYLLGAGTLGMALSRHRHRVLRDQNLLLQTRIQEAVLDIQSQKDQLAALNQEKNRLMGVLAHDLRNPLGAIQLFADGIKEAPQDTEEVVYMADRVGQATGRMMEMIRRLLDVNAIDSGGLQLALGPVDARELMAMVVEEQSPRAAAKGQRLELSLAPGLPPFHADAMHLKEVVDNLVSNAIKFTPPGPPEHPIQLRVGEGWIEVQDRGPGFLPEEIPQAFGRFARLSARPTGGETSTGLGLSIVHALVEAMGGTIQLSSEPGQGATFRVNLPVVGP